jgi:hypothetical protein
MRRTRVIEFRGTDLPLRRSRRKRNWPSSISTSAVAFSITHPHASKRGSAESRTPETLRFVHMGLGV